MPSTFTPNKDYELQSTGENEGEWGQIVNDEVTSKIDINLGSTVTKSLTNVDVNLTEDEAAAPCLRLTGTLSANILITTPAQGFLYVENLTSGSFTVTITNESGTPLALPQGRRFILFSDVINGQEVRAIASVSSTTPNSVPIGTQMFFLQAGVPAGWTLYSSLNDYGLSLTSGTGAVTSGSFAWSTVFGQSATGSTAITTAQMPAHEHTLSLTAASGGGSSAVAKFSAYQSVPFSNIPATFDNAGSGTGHSHTIDLRVKTVTCVVGARAA